MKVSLNLSPIENWIPGLNEPLVISGPCSAESEEQVMSVARELKKNPKVKVFRAGIWKPRTRPNSFEGIGEVGLQWLKRVKEETGMLTSVEVEIWSGHNLDWSSYFSESVFGSGNS
jgi:chorismate mutase